VIRVPGYEIVQEVRLGHRHTVYRGRRVGDEAPVVIKTLSGEHPASTDAERLRAEHQLLLELEIPGVARVIELEELPDRPALIMEELGERDLWQWMARRPLAVDVFLELAIQMGEIVEELHQRQVIHRDLNPTNMVIDTRVGRVGLIDFGLATRISGGAQSPGRPDQLIGTLPYIAPEQTGRMNRAVDHRADIYSLGATFYEMLTGAPPFQSSDPVEVVHGHLARNPTPPHQLAPGVPEALSAVVLKLLAKMPQQRYQSAEALRVDLEEARRQWATTGKIEPFELGRHDVVRALFASGHLYGREAELAGLLGAFDRVAAGGVEVVSITGPAGVGKSALAEAFRELLKGRRSRFISGKFDQLERNTPYAGLGEAFRGLIRELLYEPDAEIARLKAELQEAMGPNGRVITRVIPDVTRITGRQPKVPELGPVESENRLQLVFRKFVRVFATPQRPLVLFLDDLQWADVGSLRMLESLATDPETAHLMVVAAWRREELVAGHALPDTLAAIRDAGVGGLALTLSALDLDEVSSLCCDALRCEPDRARPLAELVRWKTAGNPFFIRELLKYLYRAQLLAFDPLGGEWAWDISRIEQVQVTDNVIELMLSSIRELPAATRGLLEIAACVGSSVELELLSEVAERPVSEVAGALWTAIGEGFLVPADTPLKVGEPAGRGEPEATYRFVHDRVQRAAYTLIEPGRRRALHQRIGQLQLERDPEGYFFEAIDQLNRGLADDASQERRLDLMDLNTQAGARAHEASAFSPALGYLRRAIELLPSDAVTTRHTLWFRLHRDAAQCAYFSDEQALADSLVAAALEDASGPVEEADLINIRIIACTVRGDYEGAIALGREGLSRFEVELPSRDLQAAVAAELAEAVSNLAGRSPQALLEAPAMEDEGALACMRLLSNMGAPAYFSAPDLFGLILTRMVNLSLRHGASVYAPYAFTFYGMILGTVTGDLESGHAFGRLGIALCERFADPVQKCKVVHTFANHVNHWRAHLRSDQHSFRRAFRLGLEAGELQFAGYAISGQTLHLFPLGGPLSQVLAHIDRGLEFVRNTKNKPMIDMQLAYRQAVRCLQDRTARRGWFDEPSFDTAEFLTQASDNPSTACLFEILRLQVACLMRDFDRALDYSARAGEELSFIQGLFALAEYSFYTALALAGRWGSAEEEEREIIRSLLQEHLDRLRSWESNAPENFRHKRQLVAAEIARLDGRMLDAMALYDRAIGQAKDQGYMQDEALANERAARCYRWLGRRRVANLYFREARRLYSTWGAMAVSRSLEEELDDSSEEPPAAWPSHTTDARGDRGQSRFGPPLDMRSALEAASAISSEVVLDRLLRRLITVFLRAAGAQRVVLIIEGDGGPVVRAVGSADHEDRIDLSPAPLSGSDAVPRTIIDVVRDGGLALLVDDASADSRFATDPFVAAHRVRSVVAVPIVHQSRRVGVLYAENNLATHAFTADRLQVLELLSSQIAISLENSRLFERIRRTNDELERRVGERTEALREANQSLARSNQELDEFAYIASHDLKEPLRGIGIYAQFLVEDYADKLDAEGTRKLERLTELSTRMQTLIDSLLYFSRVGRVELSDEDTDMQALVVEVLDSLQIRLDQLGIEVRIPRPLPTIRCDSVRVAEVFRNLITNAMKYNNKEERWIEIGYEGEPEAPTFYVKDNGIGIREKHLQSIFRIFKRLHGRDRYGGGAGVGLTIVKKIVERHRGAMSVRSTWGEGTTFSFNLPGPSP